MHLLEYTNPIPLKAIERYKKFDNLITHEHNLSVEGIMYWIKRLKKTEIIINKIEKNWDKIIFIRTGMNFYSVMRNNSDPKFDRFLDGRTPKNNNKSHY